MSTDSSVEVPLKRCRGCDRLKPEAEFYLRSKGGDERINRCRDCDNAKPRQRGRLKIVRQRARHRATAELVRRHGDEFATLLDYFTQVVGDEADQLAARGAPANAQAGDGTVLLRPGVQRAGQTAASRIDVSRCTACVKHHDRGHACTKCGAAPTHGRSRPDDGIVDEVAIERACRGEYVALTRTERVAAIKHLAARGYNTSRIATCLHVSGSRVDQVLADSLVGGVV